MKVVYVNSGIINSDFYKSVLTFDKIYYVIQEDYYAYLIKNDANIGWWYNKDYFKTLSEIRNDKINKLLADE